MTLFLHILTDVNTRTCARAPARSLDDRDNDDRIKPKKNHIVFCWEHGEVCGRANKWKENEFRNFSILAQPNARRNAYEFVLRRECTRIIWIYSIFAHVFHLRAFFHSHTIINTPSQLLACDVCRFGSYHIRTDQKPPKIYLSSIFATLLISIIFALSMMSRSRAHRTNKLITLHAQKYTIHHALFNYFSSLKLDDTVIWAVDFEKWFSRKCNENF